MSPIRAIFCIAVVSFLAASPALAKPPDRGPTPGLGYGKGGSRNYAVPAPVAGVGLPVLVAAGGYLWIVRRNRRIRDRKRDE